MGAPTPTSLSDVAVSEAGLQRDFIKKIPTQTSSLLIKTKRLSKKSLGSPLILLSPMG
jgi:hypothetical protein